ncbi:H-NS histone family protein [Lysobacter sp. yr284]|uniref:H-NS histone family protein n=1 Tax=Lysobacter sp. yr284 TaxID=1761791 RepID=UPI0020C8FC71|nr:H-NS histone family protein [Lysobacter sp. yr284]
MDDMHIDVESSACAIDIAFDRHGEAEAAPIKAPARRIDAPASGRIGYRHGCTIKELFVDQPIAQPAKKKRSSRRKPTKFAPKYRDPDNELNTWSGRGSMPRWLAKKIRFGQHPTDFLIPGIAKPTARTTSSVGKRTLVKQG